MTRREHRALVSSTFARFLDEAHDVTVFGKNYLAVSFKIESGKDNSDLSNYISHFRC